MSDATMQQELKDLITKHLPQATSDALQARLRQADTDAELVVTQKARLDTLIEQIRDLESKLSAANTALNNHKALDKREVELAERERVLEITLLKQQLESANTNTQFARDVAMGLVRNTEYRRTALNSEFRSEPIIPPGSSYQAGSATTNSNTNSTVEEIAK